MPVFPAYRCRVIALYTKGVKVMVTDPVCGMEIDAKDAAGTSEYQEQTYYFCSPGCKKQFDKNPQQYVGQQGDQQHPQH